jgi:hypothetical protein
MPISLRAALTVALLLLVAHHAVAEVPDDDRLACDHAAAEAERAGNLPPGMLAAIGTVESGRVDATGLYRRAWPWSINADGAGYFAASKTEAISTVRALQARGARYIDVGCFQVDLFYHPDAFTSLEQAFDPEANARAATRILAAARFSTTGWDQAIAAYHSASLLRGGWYLQRVLEAWPEAGGRLAKLDMTPRQLLAYAVLMSPEAKLVRVITASDPAPAPLTGLPRVISYSDVPGQTRQVGSSGGLPRVLTPADSAPRRAGRL